MHYLPLLDINWPDSDGNAGVLLHVGLEIQHITSNREFLFICRDVVWRGHLLLLLILGAQPFEVSLLYA